MATVLLTADAKAELDALAPTIHVRVHHVIARLAKWPAISGAKPLRGVLAGHYRVRTGDYRVQFAVAGDVVTIEKIGHRDGFYDA